MEKIFAGKVAVVTGGSFGIGRATAVAFAKRGAKVVIADYVEDTKNETARQVQENGSEALFIRCNVASENEVSGMIAEAVKKMGHIDFAFNNAGIEGATGPIQSCTANDFDKTISVNLRGVWLCMKYEIEQMLQQGGGAIVNCSSIAGLNGFAGLAPYVASKHAVLGLTKTAALENATQQIRVNAVCPGVIHTDMIDRVTGKDPVVEKQYIAMEPIGRMGTPEEVAEAVVWLCSDAASFVTGIAMPVDGAYTTA